MMRLKRGIPDRAVGPQPKGNRPDHKPRQPGNILFHDAGSTGWGRKRNLGNYKGTRSETDFRHEHGKFADPSEAEEA